MTRFRIFGEMQGDQDWESLGIQLVPGEAQEEGTDGELVCYFYSLEDYLEAEDRVLRDIAFPDLNHALLTGYTSNFALQRWDDGESSWVHVRTFQVDQDEVARELGLLVL